MPLCQVSHFFATLNVVMLNVATLSVVAPFKVQVQEKQNGAINFKKLSLHLQGACIIKLFTAVIFVVIK
jgi:hypothetical protein